MGAPTSPSGPRARAGRRQPLRSGAAVRVARSHAQTRATLRFSLAFLAAAAVAAAAGASRWVVLHLTLAGGLVLAISGVSLMLAVTWAAAPAPSDRAVWVQRLLVVAGSVGVVAGRTAEAPAAVVGVAGAAHVGGVTMLAVLLIVTARRGVERRFDPAVAGYTAALAAGVAGTTIGVVMGVDGPTGELRAAHVALNLLGLVGLVVGATMPFFAATVGRSRMSPLARPPTVVAILATMTLGLATAGLALAFGSVRSAAAGFALYAAGIAGVLAVLPRPTRRQLRWAGPRMLALWCGGAWWAVAVTATAVEAARGSAVLTGRWLEVIVLGGFLQIVWGSLAYLLPMLRGGGAERLAAGFATTRSWIGLAAVNIAAVAAAFSAPRPVMAAAAAAWVLDTAWRLARVGTRRADRARD